MNTLLQFVLAIFFMVLVYFLTKKITSLWRSNREGINGSSDTHSQSPNAEQAVIVHFNYALDTLEPLYEVEEQFEQACSKSNVGELDGHEIAVDNSDGYFYFYGQDADKLLEEILPVLKSTSFLKGATILKRYGPPGETTRQVEMILETI